MLNKSGRAARLAASLLAAAIPLHCATHILHATAGMRTTIFLCCSCGAELIATGMSDREGPPLLPQDDDATINRAESDAAGADVVYVPVQMTLRVRGIREGPR